MELSKNDTKALKGIAILLMVLLHLFALKDVNGLYETYPLINGVPLVYYIGLMGDAAPPIYMFVTGYALYLMIHNSKNSILAKNIKRILKLYVNFWVIFAIFIPLGFLIGSEKIFQLNIGALVLEFLGMNNAYNGAWWFLQTYVIVVFLSPFLVYLALRCNSLILFVVSGGIFVVSHFQRYHSIIDVGDHAVALYFDKVIYLFGAMFFSFVTGAIFAKEKIYTRIYNRFYHIKFKNTLCLLGIAALIVVHGIIESAIIAPVNSIFLIVLFMLMDKSESVKKALDFFGDHSTNIWLTHMFFYLTIFPELTFAPKYPLLIFVWLLALCIGSSYVINFLSHPLVKWVDRLQFHGRLAANAVGRDERV